MSTTPARSGFGIGAPVARAADFGVGKWSRVGTYGVKKQKQADGSFRTFTFTDSTFAQGLRNFRQMFAARGKGLGSDYEHQTLNAPTNGRPAPNLCYFGALAWVNQQEQLAGLEDVRGDALPLDPAVERARLSAEHPESDPNPAGLWAYCSEVTPLGQQLIPNYSQLSMLFNDREVDEEGREIGFALSNVSFVNVAFLGGASYQFKGTPTMNIEPEMHAKLCKHGFDPAMPESIHEAYHKYMATTSDGPEERAKIAEHYKKFSADAQSGGPGVMPKGEPIHTAEPAAPGSMSGVEDKDHDGMAKMSKIYEGQIASLTKRVEIAESVAQRVASETEARSRKEYQVKLAAFRKEMLESANARYLPEQAADLDTLIADVGGDLDKARRHAERMPPLAAFKRITQGGNPLGLNSVPPPGLSAMSRTDKGYSFNKAVADLRAKEKGLSIEEAQLRIAAEQPDLYNGAL